MLITLNARSKNVIEHCTTSQRVNVIAFGLNVCQTILQVSIRFTFFFFFFAKSQRFSESPNAELKLEMRERGPPEAYAGIRFGDSVKRFFNDSFLIFSFFFSSRFFFPLVL